MVSAQMFKWRCISLCLEPSKENVLLWPLTVASMVHDADIIPDFWEQTQHFLVHVYS